MISQNRKTIFKNVFFIVSQGRYLAFFFTKYNFNKNSYFYVNTIKNCETSNCHFIDGLQIMYQVWKKKEKNDACGNWRMFLKMLILNCYGLLYWNDTCYYHQRKVVLDVGKEQKGFFFTIKSILWNELCFLYIFAYFVKNSWFLTIWFVFNPFWLTNSRKGSVRSFFHGSLSIK